MSLIRETIEKANSEKRLALSIYITSGYPEKEGFVDLALSILNAGADMLEIGMPFSDPLADGPVIQKSSFAALQNGVTPKLTLEYCAEIRKRTSKPIILMGYLNPILKYRVHDFLEEAKDCGVNGLIIPDLPLEEHVRLFDQTPAGIDITLLTTPTSSEKRIRAIDSASSGFVYCVSVTGTTGARKGFNEEIYSNLKRTYDLIEKNKMMIGFGISKGEDIAKLAAYCDGVIVGSAVINKLTSDMIMKNSYRETRDFVKELYRACRN